MNLLEKQEFNPVKNVNRQMALARIADAVLRFERSHNYRASVMQVGAKLFAAAFPGSEHPEAMGHVGIFPRPDICGEWAIVIPKPKESAGSRIGITAYGIEIEEKYCEIAAKRLSQEVFQFGNSSE